MNRPYELIMAEKRIRRQVGNNEEEFRKRMFNEAIEWAMTTNDGSENVYESKKQLAYRWYGRRW